MISRLPQLESLDMCPVTDKERQNATARYGALKLVLVRVM